MTDVIVTGDPLSSNGLETKRGLLGYQETAQYLGVSIRTVHALADDGSLPRIRLRGRVLFALTDLMAFIERSRSAA
jgi:excisionase family DNA binding protein